jgi:AraC-like DNA-binding protein
MPSSTILKLTDPYEYQIAMCRATAADSKTIVTSSGRYQSELTLIDLHRLGLQHARISLPRIGRGAPRKDLCLINFPTADNQAQITFNGIEQPQSSISFYCPGAEYIASMSAECHWGGISLPPDILAAASEALVGCEITAPKVLQILCPPPPLMARLQKLHATAAQLAATVPDIVSHPELARAIEQELLRALIACLASSANIKAHHPNRAHVLQRFHQVVEANQYQPLYLAEVCVAVGVTERTLYNICMEYLGLSPHRYLWLRRMNLVRRALVSAGRDMSAQPASVTRIANDHGFGELGRFSAQYRAMFGEPPSATLRRTSN